jgi:FtsH-binding integral membrane protein
MVGDKMLQDNKIFSKIFFWMFIGLAITFGIGYYVSLNENMLYNVFSKYYIFLIIAELVVVIWLSARIRKMKPTTAKLLFCAYSFLTGLTFSSIFVVYKITSIVMVFGITSLIFLIFALIGYYTKLDLTKIGTYLFMILLGVIICSLINMFVGSETFDLALTIICLIVFIVYVAYDIHIIKRNLYAISEEDNLAIYGALQLYLDFINIFLRLLQLFGRNRD